MQILFASPGVTGDVGANPNIIAAGRALRLTGCGFEDAVTVTFFVEIVGRLRLLEPEVPVRDQLVLR